MLAGHDVETLEPMSTARCLHYSYAEYLDALSMSELDLPGLGALAVSALYAQ